jgi:LEA14-like dessication related protein
MIILGTSCAYKNVELVEVKSVHVDEFSSDNVQVTASLVLKNPNGFEVNIKDSDLNLYVNDYKMARAIIKRRIKIPENTVMTHDLVFDSSLEDVGGGVLRSLISVISRGVVKIGIKGSVNATAFKMTEKVPVDVEGDVKVDMGDFFTF